MPGGAARLCRANGRYPYTQSMPFASSRLAPPWPRAGSRARRTLSGPAYTQPCSHIQPDLPVGPHVLPEQRGQAPAVGLAELPGPGLGGEDVLEHEGVDVDEGGLQDAQAQRGHLDLFAAVGGDVPAAAVADHRVGAVPGLDDVQALFDLPLQAAVAQVAGDE